MHAQKDILSFFTTKFPRMTADKEVTQECLNTSTLDRVTPLTFAAEMNHVAACDYLLQYHADLLDHQRHFRGNSLQTPLSIAIKRGHIGIIARMIEWDDSFEHLNLKNAMGHTLLMQACLNGRLDIIRYFVNNCAGSIDFNQTDHEGNTLFLKACEKGQLCIVRYLVEHFRCMFNLNEADYLGHTPIMKAITSNHTSLLTYLISKSELFDCHQCDMDFINPVMMAYMSDNPEIFRLLLDELSSTLDFNATDNANNTLLMIVCLKQDLPIAQHLLEHYGENIDVSISNLENMTALDIAVSFNNQPLIDVLQKFAFKERYNQSSLSL
jgi:ankyrin repeat protein